MDLIVLTDGAFGEEEGPAKDIRRAIELSNEEWSVVAQCVEAFADTYRAKHSQVVATYVTRKQLPEAQAEAKKMNDLLMKLDRLQALL
jgi:hypothetical protein